jgi:hypothetical protein
MIRNENLVGNGIEVQVIHEFVILNGKCVFVGDVQNVLLEDYKKQHCIILGYKDDYCILQIDAAPILRFVDKKRVSRIRRVYEYDMYRKLDKTIGIVINSELHCDNSEVYVYSELCQLCSSGVISAIWVHADTKRVAMRNRINAIYVDGKYIGRYNGNVIWSADGKRYYHFHNDYGKYSFYLDGKLIKFPKRFEDCGVIEYFFSPELNQPTFILGNKDNNYQVIIRRKEDNWTTTDVKVSISGEQVEVIWLDYDEVTC